MSLNPIIINNIDKIKSLCVEHNVASLYAFGSVCSENFSTASDIDLLVSFKPMEYGDYADSYFFLADKLEELFKRRVDLVTEKSLNNPYFIKAVNQTRTHIYG
jgi:uncharacterized protein